MGGSWESLKSFSLDHTHGLGWVGLGDRGMREREMKNKTNTSQPIRAHEFNAFALSRRARPTPSGAPLARACLNS